MSSHYCECCSNSHLHTRVMTRDTLLWCWQLDVNWWMGLCAVVWWMLVCKGAIADCLQAGLMGVIYIRLIWQLQLLTTRTEWRTAERWERKIEVEKRNLEKPYNMKDVIVWYLSFLTVSISQLGNLNTFTPLTFSVFCSSSLSGGQNDRALRLPLLQGVPVWEEVCSERGQSLLY